MKKGQTMKQTRFPEEPIIGVLKYRGENQDGGSRSAVRRVGSDDLQVKVQAWRTESV
jgi:hypothetical protein